MMTPRFDLKKQVAKLGADSLLPPKRVVGEEIDHSSVVAGCCDMMNGCDYALLLRIHRLLFPDLTIKQCEDQHGCTAFVVSEKRK